MMNTVAIVQARMSSTRLAGKVLKPLDNDVVLSHVLNRLSKCSLISQVVVATTVDDVDDQLVNWCEKHGVNYFRGDRIDVLSRYYDCATIYAADVIVRITSDNPLIDPEIIDKVIELRHDSGADYAANNIEKSFPHGLDVEVITYEALKVSNEDAVEQFEREHVTQFVRHRVKSFKLINLNSGGNWHHVRVTLDEEEDYQLIKIIFRLCGNDVRFNDLKKIFLEFPMLSRINSSACDRHVIYNQESNVI